MSVGLFNCCFFCMIFNAVLFFQTCIIIEIFYYSGVLWFVKIIMHLIQIDYPNKLILVSEKKEDYTTEKKQRLQLEEKQND